MSSKTTLYDPLPLDPERAPTENVLLVVPVPKSESGASTELFTNAYPFWQPGTGNAVFGGVLIGQAIQAAYQTVSPGFAIHYLSCSFLAGPEAARPLYFSVTRPHNARGYATREVRAYQDEERTVLSITCRFVLTENTAPELLSTTMPQTSSPPPPWTELKNDPALAEKMVRSDFLHLKGQSTTRADVDPFIWHYCNPRPDASTIDLTVADSTTSKPASYELHAWVRSRGGLISKDHTSRTAVLGCLTDSWFLAGVADMMPQHIDRNFSRVRRIATMDHHIWFHETEPEMNDWMLVRTRVTWAAQGRCLLEQHVWSRQGRLVLSCVQEAILRVSGPGQKVNVKL